MKIRNIMDLIGIISLVEIKLKMLSIKVKIYRVSS